MIYRILSFLVELISVMLVGLFLTTVGCAAIVLLYHLCHFLKTHIWTVFVVIFIAYMLLYVFYRIGDHMNE